MVAATLNEWVSAHERLLQEENRLFELAGRLAARTCSVHELEAQLARFKAAQNLDDGLYERAMELLRVG